MIDYKLMWTMAQKDMNDIRKEITAMQEQVSEAYGVIESAVTCRKCCDSALIYLEKYHKGLQND